MPPVHAWPVISWIIITILCKKFKFAIMLISMTGYGRAECDLSGMVYSIEIKSLNSKQLDISVKIPLPLRDREPEIRNMLNNELQRGKIEIGIYQELKEGSTGYSINKPVVKEYIRDLRQIAQDAGLEESDRILQAAMQLPDSMKSEKGLLGEEDWSKSNRLHLSLLSIKSD